MLLEVVAFVVALGVLILVHEYGHFSVARACGVKVLRFSLGFGRVIWRRQRTAESTEFTLSALPLGGYVRMLDEREGPVPVEQRGQAFNLKPLRQRVAIVAAGPVANFLLAIVLFTSLAWMGQQEPLALLGTPKPGGLAERAGMRAGDRVMAIALDGRSWQDIASAAELQWPVIEAITEQSVLSLQLADAGGHGRREVRLDMAELGTREPDLAAMTRLGLGGPLREPVIGEVAPGGAAAQAGLQAGDRVLDVDGRMVADAAQLIGSIRAHAQAPDARAQQWRIERRGQVLSLTVTPAVVEEGAVRIGRIQALVGSAPQTVLVSHPLDEALFIGVRKTWEQSWMTLKIFGRMLIGQASLKNLSGPITIADAAGQAARVGLHQYLSLLAMLSVGLGVLNLLPLPMLDGGHLMYYLFEGLSGRPVSEWWLERLQRAGFFLMLLMMALALSNDVTRKLGLH
ncbi:RIP metalloprotease RseP [Mitsuaria sp. WAJ17]|uniref:RIP metalloprotease RseP n=1 Tax=Mitsuaria sp. WAJ17 TaxID=2761452 RepID=UPI00160341D0|nr:RIP metalloprotease RseP [Mitsuaria sp. WAJ17]MBB2483939.1 RIP metalloprotease RseP [Mitsuaria sp. WAJ17]